MKKQFRVTRALVTAVLRRKPGKQTMKVIKQINRICRMNPHISPGAIWGEAESMMKESMLKKRIAAGG